MRLVAWNCNRGLPRDLPAIRALGADVAVLSEVPASPPPHSLFDQQPSWLWVEDGAPGHGLALAGFDVDLTPYECAETSGFLSLAAVHPTGLGILGICGREQNRAYAPEVLRTIEAHRSWLASEPRVVAGDFNLAPGGDEDLRNGGCRRVFDELNRLGYVSLYHHTTGEAYGAETKPTYFHWRDQGRGFHIDHCFVHHDLLTQVAAYYVGDFETWVARTDSGAGHSDHVPLILDLDLNS